jgi:hypothetical protein
LSLLVFESIYKSYFTFRQTGTHPPFSFWIIQLITKKVQKTFYIN